MLERLVGEVRVGGERCHANAASQADPASERRERERLAGAAIRFSRDRCSVTARNGPNAEWPVFLWFRAFIGASLSTGSAKRAPAPPTPHR
jgi:hypothetical protein